MFKPGDFVVKKAGYPFPGEVKAVFKARNGRIVCVVESATPEIEGMLHICDEDELEKNITPVESLITRKNLIEKIYSEVCIANGGVVLNPWDVRQAIARVLRQNLLGRF